MISLVGDDTIFFLHTSTYRRSYSAGTFSHTQLHIVNVGLNTVFENPHQLVAVTLESTHAAVTLGGQIPDKAFIKPVI